MPENYKFYPKDKVVVLKISQPPKQISYILEGFGEDAKKDEFELQFAFPTKLEIGSEQRKALVKTILGQMVAVHSFRLNVQGSSSLLEIPVVAFDSSSLPEALDLKIPVAIKLIWKGGEEGTTQELKCLQEIQLQGSPTSKPATAPTAKPTVTATEEKAKKPDKIVAKAPEKEEDEEDQENSEETDEEKPEESPEGEESEEKDEEKPDVGQYSGLVSVDYGTTNSTVAVRDPCFAAEEVRGQLGQAQWQALCDWMNIWMGNHLTNLEPKDLDIFVQNLTLIVPNAHVPECGAPTEEIQEALHSLDDGSRVQILQELISRLSSDAASNTPDVPPMMKHLAYESLKGFEAVIDANSLESQRYFILELDRNIGPAPISSVLQVISVPASEDPAVLAEETKVDMGARVALLLHSAALGEIDIRQFVLSSKRYFGSDEMMEVSPSEGNGEVVQLPASVFAKLTYRELMKRAVEDIHRRAEMGLFQDATWPRGVVSTFPTVYPAGLRQQLKDIFINLGIQEIDARFDEATAAAIYYIWREIGADPVCGMHGLMARSRKDKYERSYQNILLYDFGGGTTDVALIQLLYEELPIFEEGDDRGNGGCYFRITPRLLGTTGHRYLGGDLLTLWFFRYIKSKLADFLLQLLITKNIEPPTDSPLNALLSNLPEELTTHAGAESMEGNAPVQYRSGALLEWAIHPTQFLRKYNEWNDKVIDVLIPTRFINDRSRVPHFFTLWEMTDEIKKSLGTPIIENFGTCLGMGLAKNWPNEVEIDSGQLYNFFKMVHPWLVDAGHIQQDDLRMLMLQQEMNSVISDTVKQSMSLAASLAKARLQSETKQDRVDRLILAGLSCNMKAIQDVAKEVFRSSEGVFDYSPSSVRFDRDSAKTSVALGACIGRYMESVRVDPFNEKTKQMLLDGYDQIELVIENLFCYLPCRIAYDSLVAMVPIFEQGQELNVKSYWDENKKVARTSILDLRPVQEKFWIYRIDFPGAEPQYLGLIDSEQVAAENGFEDFRKFRESYVVGFEADAELMIRCFYLPKGNEIIAKDFVEPTSQGVATDLISVAEVENDETPLKRQQQEEVEEEETEEAPEEEADGEEAPEEEADGEEASEEEADGEEASEEAESEEEEPAQKTSQPKKRSPKVPLKGLVLNRAILYKSILDDVPVIPAGERLNYILQYPDGTRKQCCLSHALTIGNQYEFRASRQNHEGAVEGEEPETLATFTLDTEATQEATFLCDEDQRMIMLTQCLFEITISSEIQFTAQKADSNYDPFCGCH